MGDGGEGIVSNRWRIVVDAVIWMGVRFANSPSR